MQINHASYMWWKISGRSNLKAKSKSLVAREFVVFKEAVLGRYLAICKQSFVHTEAPNIKSETAKRYMKNTVLL